MATGTIPNPNSECMYYWLTSNKKLTLTISSGHNSCAIFGMRGTGNRIAKMADVWNDYFWSFGDGGVDGGLTFTKSGRTVTISTTIAVGLYLMGLSFVSEADT